MAQFDPSSAVSRLELHSLRGPMGGPPPEGTVSLAMGEPDFDTPPAIISSAVAALNAGATHYVAQQGDPDLRSALASAVSSLAGRPCHVDEVLVTHGATAGLAAAVLAVVDPGDKVVLPEPCYSLYSDLVRLAGGTPVLVPPAPDLHWNLDALRSALVGARLMIFSNPCNPTGVVHTRLELEAIGQALRGTDTLVISDEAYSAIVYDQATFHSTLSVDELRDRTIYCQTLSKAFAMTGWRVGYLTGPADVIAAATRIHMTFNGSINAAVQRAALTAIEEGQTLVEPMLTMYRKRRDAFFDRLTDIPFLSAPLPEGTFYAFASYDLDMTSIELAKELHDAGVLIRPGAEYGPSGEGHIRFSFAADLPVIDEALARLDRYLRARN